MIFEQRPVVVADDEGVPITQESSAGPPAGHLQRVVPESTEQASVGQVVGQSGRVGPSVLQIVVLVEKAKAVNETEEARTEYANTNRIVLRTE